METFRLLLNSKGTLPQDNQFYKNAIIDIEYFSVSAQIYYSLKQDGRLHQTPPFFQDQLRRNYEKVLYQNMFLKNQTDKVLDLFEAKGIDVIPLKGIKFAEKYFGNIGARATSDIDLLIKPDHVQKALECIQPLGFEMEEAPIPGHFHCSLSKKIPHSMIPLTIELHWDILRKDTAQLKIEDFWSQALSVGTSNHIWELSLYHTFYMICLHGWRHNLDSIKYFIDIMQVLTIAGPTLSYRTLFRDAIDHKTSKRLKRTLAIVYHEFPHLSSIKRFPYSSRKTYWNYDDIRYERKTKKTYINFFHYLFFSYDSVFHVVLEMTNWVFPSKYELHATLGEAGINRSAFMNYTYLYTKRMRSVFDAVFKRLKHRAS
ncbi:nucleotidyltransferase family protein [Fictibacillus enclensis]|uniref:nucleotidyltransferase family protein n=1 Tax=Fictibacillus enclensis TaxID=1017270 RepID=UPI0024C0258A|nr:nucleotidyltransferase family protein [Fictibacillus enclensis]WHY75024.1 nucleotidyltransferase family protein [Fictibacillus enclensis]